MMKKYFSYAFAMSVIVASGLQAHLVKPQSELVKGGVAPAALTVNDPILVFKSTGGKYPYMLDYRPAQNEFKTVLFGASGEKGIRLIDTKNPADLVNLTPASSDLKFLDARLKISRKYFREAYLGNLLVSCLTVSKLLEAEPYKGIPLVDEMQAGIAMKWILQNPEELRGMISYIQTKATSNSIAFKNKPKLLLELLTNADQLTDRDYALINRYFTLVSPNDEQTLDFYNKATAFLTEITTSDVKYSNVAESIAQSFVRQVEEEYNGLKTADILAYGAKVGFCAVTGSLVVLAINEMVGNPIKNTVKSCCGAIKGIFSSEERGGRRPFGY